MMKHKQAKQSSCCPSLSSHVSPTKAISILLYALKSLYNGMILCLLSKDIPTYVIILVKPIIILRYIPKIYVTRHSYGLK
jgi:hypothetical protein